MKQHEIIKHIYILHFMLQGIQCCLDLNVVQKVIPLTFIEKIPNSANYLVGIMNLSGISVPVLDLALRINLQHEKKYTLDTPIVICHDGISDTGLVVDKIMGIELINEAALQRHGNLSDMNSPVLGVIEINHKLVLMLDVKTILDMSKSIDNSTLVHKLTQDG